MLVRAATLFVFLLGVATAAAQPPAPPAAKGPKLRWLGQSFFVIETSKGTRVAIDPHQLDPFGRPKAKADLVLITHPHPDHMRVDAIENKAQAKIIEGIKVVPGPEGAPRKSQWNPVDETFRDVKVTSVPTYHDAMQGLTRGKNTCFVLEFDGLRLCHLGDLGHTLSEEQLRAIGPIDVLLIPVGGVYTLNGDTAKKVVAQIKPKKYVIPMHFGTRQFDDLPGVDEFIDGQSNVKMQIDSNELALDVHFKPAEPLIVVLGVKKE